MSEDKNNAGDDLEATLETADEAHADLPEESPPEESPEAAADENASAEVAELKDQVLRTLAEMENIKMSS